MSSELAPPVPLAQSALSRRASPARPACLIPPATRLPTHSARASTPPVNRGQSPTHAAAGQPAGPAGLGGTARSTLARAMATHASSANHAPTPPSQRRSNLPRLLHLAAAAAGVKIWGGYRPAAHARSPAATASPLCLSFSASLSLSLSLSLSQPLSAHVLQVGRITSTRIAQVRLLMLSLSAWLRCASPSAPVFL
jgi:hypothetical protein